jgi:predicted O-methyltransferase YrrM
VPDPAEAAARVQRIAGPPPAAVPGIIMDVEAMRQLWRVLALGMADCDYCDERSDARRYYYTNDFYGYGDALIFRSMLKYLAPQRLVEIGSGFSSAVALDTRDAFGLPRELTFIEPYPEDRLRDLLRPDDEARTRVLVNLVQDVPLEIFAVLEANDVLFVDSSHVMKTGSDLHHILFEILPCLRPGVVVHFHDIFWPFEYPAPWAVDQLRGWNEIYVLRAFLTGNADYEILLFNDYYAKLHAAEVKASAPLVARNPGGGLWLRKLRG